jgi:alkylation response protein AidB-like acyl-CoA dehydrogenase
LRYARDRLQMRSLSGREASGQAGRPMIVHADVRRMLLTQKAFAEGGRALTYAYLQVDISTIHRRRGRTQARR